MSILDYQFPFYGKLQNGDEIYVMAYYNPVNSFTPTQNNQRLAGLTYLNLISSAGKYPFRYTTVNTKKNGASADLLFTPAINSISTFVVSEVCNNSFKISLKLNNELLPVYLSPALNQDDSDIELASSMFTVYSDEQNNVATINYTEYNYGVYYGRFLNVQPSLSPVYRKACFSNQCGCTGECCIPVLSNSLTITSICNVQENIKNNTINSVLIVPKLTKTISESKIIYSDQNSIFNFMYFWDITVNQNIVIKNIYYYSSSLFKSLDIAQQTFEVRYCFNIDICGNNGCYGECSTDCLSKAKSCYVLSTNAECVETGKEPKPVETGGSNVSFIVSIVFFIVILIALIGFIIIAIIKPKSKYSKLTTYNVKS